MMTKTLARKPQWDWQNEKTFARCQLFLKNFRRKSTEFSMKTQLHISSNSKSSSPKVGTDGVMLKSFVRASIFPKSPPPNSSTKWICDAPGETGIFPKDAEVLLIPLGLNHHRGIDCLHAADRP